MSGSSKLPQAILPIVTAIAHPCDDVSLDSAVEAAKLKVIVPILVGPTAHIRDVAVHDALDVSPFELIDSAYSNDSPDRAVGLVRAVRA